MSGPRGVLVGGGGRQVAVWRSVPDLETNDSRGRLLQGDAAGHLPCVPTLGAWGGGRSLRGECTVAAAWRQRWRRVSAAPETRRKRQRLGRVLSGVRRSQASRPDRASSRLPGRPASHSAVVARGGKGDMAPVA